MFIFKILLHVWMFTFVFTCMLNNEKRNYYSCLGQWTLIQKHSMVGYAGYLKTPSLLDDICILPSGVSVEEMDRCVIQNVSPLCDSLMAHWSGIKEFVNFLCRNRETFIANECRKSTGFQNRYTICMAEQEQNTKTKAEDCRKFTNLRKCLVRALKRHCTIIDRQFFEVAFSSRDSPLEAYACNLDQTTITTAKVLYSGGEVALQEVYLPIKNTANSQHWNTCSLWIMVSLLLKVFH